MDAKDYKVKGSCSCCPDPSTKFEYKAGNIFEYCYLCYRGLTPERREYNGRR